MNSHSFAVYLRLRTLNYTRMIYRALFIVLTLIAFTSTATAQQIKTYKFEELESKFHVENDTTYIINFWAMWCKPCVEELPEFEHIRKDYTNKKVKLLLISLDFGKNVESRIIKFLNKNKINIETVVLDDPDADTWIGKVNSNWDGALPATIVYKQDQRKFFNGKIGYQELAKTIDQFNN